MAKIIKLSPEMVSSCEEEFNVAIEKAKADFRSRLTDAKITNGKIVINCGSFTKTFDSIANRKAKLHFTELAYMKMTALVREFSLEVAWHGVAFRDPDETKDEYYITDILCYPQEVSAAKVDTDQAEYQNWMFDLEDDKFNNLRMQGHSHVNMSVYPSGTDEANQEEILASKNEDEFYIFMIWNKRDERNIKIYDIKKNVLFEPADVEVVIDDMGIGIDKFVSEAKKMVKTKTYQNTYQGYNGSGYYSGSYKPNAGTAVTPAASTQKSLPVVKEEAKPEKKKKSFEEISSPKNAAEDDYDDYDYDDYDYCGRSYWAKLAAKDPFYASDKSEAWR